MKKLTSVILLLALIVFGLAAYFGPNLANFVPGLKFLSLQKSSTSNSAGNSQSGAVKVVTEESVVIDVVKKVTPSVVTVSIKKTVSPSPLSDLGPLFDPFGFFNNFQTPPQSSPQNVQEDIGSGFIISADGLVVTSKHVVSDTQAGYQIITADNKTYDVQKIYRDPGNDLAILKISPPAGVQLPAVEMGDSSKLQVGQMAIAIGTALGEFRSTVTTGVVSGLGRGITAGDPLAGSVEQLDNVIQTDAAINPGNSGGPLLNSSGQVIGINTAVSTQGQNIGFAIPINVVKNVIQNFNETGQFNRAFLGVEYRLIDQKTALLNGVPQGAYIMNVVPGSSADKGGLKADDIITKIDGQAINSQSSLANIIAGHKVGDTIAVEYYRDGSTHTTSVTLTESKQ
ncbi:MAG: trypsin-like peptidase domain-containing protein [Patescibacteria group bacterium]|nr:trypsin-like peptidase domain-containing protein [Patescibacteria group bacterium]